ncbi:MAG: hypothetical protein WCB85_06060 [Candidatus Dormiibacterota bacterium]
MFYDNLTNDIVVVGGETFPPGGGTSQTLNDAWTLDAQGWHSGARPNSVPGLLVEDPATDDLMAVGATPATGQGLQTWSWNSSAWTPLSSLPIAAGWMVRGIAPLGNQLVLVAENKQETVTQTWTWTGRAWRREHPAKELPLNAGLNSAGPFLSADPAHGRVVAVLQTGLGAGGETQVWAWAGTTWRLVVSTYLLGVDEFTATLAPDPQNGSVLLYMNPVGSAPCTWELNGPSWHEIQSTSPAVDTAYGGAALLIDARLGRVILIGGPGRPNPLNTLWVFNGSTWAAEPASILAGSSAPQ